MAKFRWLTGLLIAALVAAVPTADAIQVSLPQVTAAPGEKVRVPVQVDGFSGEEIFSTNIDIYFDAALAVLDSVKVDQQGSLTANWFGATNPRLVPGDQQDFVQVLIGLATARDSIAQAGTFFYLELKVPESAPVGASTPLTIGRVSLNSGTPTATTQDGLLTIIDSRIKADFIAHPLEGIAPLEVRFTDASTGDVETYLWDFGDGETSSQVNPVHLYEEADDYTVSLTVTGQSSGDTETKEDYIHVSPDQRPPEIIEGPIALGTTHNATTIFWKTNELGNSHVQYCGLRLRPRWGNLDELIAGLKDELGDGGELGEGCGDDDDDDDDDDDGDNRRKPVARPGSDPDANLFGGLRLKNFSSQSGAEIFLGDGELGDRVEQDFYQSNPCGSDEEVNGEWESSNRISLSYDPDSGLLRTEVEASHTFCKEYALGDVEDLDYLQIDVVSRDNGATVKLKNVRLNGHQLGSITSSGWETWKVADYDLSEGFTLEGDLELSGTQPNGETNKVQIRFGRGSGDDDDDEEDECGNLVHQLMLRGELPHFGENAAALYPLIIHCGQVLEDELVLDHEVRLTGLTPFTFYIYRVRSADDDGNYSAWKGGFFITRSRPDDEPPLIILGPQVTPADDRALIVWETDEPGNSFVQYGVDEDFDDDNRITIPELVHRHEVWLENLQENTLYYYRVRSTDASGNGSPLKRGSFRTTGGDVTPPVIWNGPRVTLRTPFKALVEWRTDEPSIGRVDFGTTDDYGRFVQGERLLQRHKMLLTHLDPQTVYHFRVIATDVNGNVGTSDDQTFVTRGHPDVRPCGIVRHPYLITRFHDRVILGWGLDEVGRGHIEFGTTEEYGRTVEISEFKREHALTLTGLSPGTRYYCRVNMVDLEGNGPTLSRRLEFWTSSRRDSEAPVIEGQPILLERTDTQGTVAWTTDEASDSAVEFGETAGYGRSAGSPDLVRHHEVRLTGLEPGGSYHFRVSSTDAAGNGPTSSGDFTFSTRPTPDEESPVILAGPAVVARSEDSAIVEWWTSEPTDGMVDYGLGNSYGAEGFSERFGRRHRVHLANLDPGTVYHFRVSSTDAAGNGPTSSPDLTFTTEERVNRDPPRIWGVSVRKATNRTCLIEWRTNRPSDSAVDYGNTSDYGERGESPHFVRRHQHRLSGLDPDTEYHFEVKSRDISGNRRASRNFSFRTARERDSAPPVVVEGPEIVATHATATFLWRTSEPCFASVIAGSEGTFGTPAEWNFASLEAKEEHRITITGLQRGTRYLFSLLSRDLEGNETVLGEPRRSGKIVRPLGTGGEISFVTAPEPDFAAPTIVSGPRLVAQTDSEALIAWDTDEIGDSRIFLEKNGEMALAEFLPEHDFEHQILLTDLEPGTTYRAQVASADPVGNGPAQSQVFTFTTSANVDAAPPELTETPAAVEVGDRVVTIAWETDEASSSEVRFGADELDGVFSNPDLTIEHQIQLVDLVPGTTYRYQIRSYDAQENGPAESDILSFTTASLADVQPPRIVATPSAVQVSDQSAVIVWETDEVADGFVHFGIDEELAGVIGRAELTTEHRVVLAHLEPSTTYNFKVASADRAGNGPGESDLLTLTTLARPDGSPPPAPTNLAVNDEGSGQTLLSWEPSAATDVAGYYVYRALGTAEFDRVAGPLMAATYRDLGLTDSGEYRYGITAVDLAGNEGPVSEEIAIAIEANRPGDFQGDGQVDFDDFFMLAGQFGKRNGDSGYGNAYDLNSDEKISFDDFFLFVDLFGTSYRSGRVVADAGEAIFQPELHLEPGDRAGTFALNVRVLESRHLRGYGLGFEFDPRSVSFLGAEQEGTGFFAGEGSLSGVLEESAGSLSLAGYRSQERPMENNNGLLARLHFRLQPGVAPAPVRLVEVAGIDVDGRFGTALLADGVARISLLPATYILEQNAPNPFNPQTEIRFQLPQAGPVTMRVYDLLGQVVTVLVDGQLPAGYHRAVWDGRDAAGRAAASGLYFYVMETKDFRQARKLLLLR
jgi:PKD repeat protein